MLKQLNKSFKFATILVVSIILTLGFSISLQSLLAAWTAPSFTPPTNNIADLNLGGGLSVATNALVMGNFSTMGNIGIGTINPTEKFEVAGKIYSTNGGFKFPDGTIQTTAAVSAISQWISNGNNISNANTGNVGIGTTNPIYKLDVNGSIKTIGSSVFAQIDNISKNYATAPIQIREAQYGATGSYLPPRLSFHWGGVVASQIGIESNGRIAILNNPGTGYENFIAKDITTTGQLYGSGSQTTYGALSVNGAKAGWSGINFRGGTTNYGTLMMNANHSGFFNAADNGWRWYVDNTGNSYQPGNANINDVYIRAAGKWASQLGGGVRGLFTINFAGGCAAVNPFTGACSCPSGSNAYLAGTFYMNGFWSSAPDRLYQCI